jgi:hypothetical protein
MSNVACGFTGHGLIGTSYTHEQVEELCRKDLEEMENLAAGLEDDSNDKEEDTDDPNKDPSHVIFGPTSTLNKSLAPHMPTGTQLHDDLIETTCNKGKENVPNNCGID